MSIRKYTDKKKRLILKAVAGSGAYVASSNFVSAREMLIGSNDVASNNLVELAVTLIKRNESSLDSLWIHNTNGQAVRIKRFFNHDVMVEGNLVNCDGACSGVVISLLPNEKREYTIHPLAPVVSDRAKNRYLNPQVAIRRSTDGTRFLSLIAQVVGDNAILRDHSLVRKV